MDFKNVRHIVVGAGLWGGTMAECIASRLGEQVCVLEKRAHIGGNCHSAIDAETGIECHIYGTHIFHTKIAHVWEYINKFSSFTSYKHKVWTEYQGRVYPMPISLATINSYYNTNLKPYEVADFIRKEAGKEAGGAETPRNLEDKAISLVGRPLYEAFFKGYTQKQWGQEPKLLPPEIITRLPVRADYNTDYFNDTWQGLPLQGYTALFTRLFDNPKITVHTGVNYADVAKHLPKDCTVYYTGPIDELCGNELGHLEWRSLRFETSVEPYSDFLGTAVLNQADVSVPYTRAHEYKHLHPERGEQGKKTVVTREYPKNFVHGDEPYYPVNTPGNEKLLAAYREKVNTLSMQEPRIVLGGRLGLYRYMDMDKTIEDALQCFTTLFPHAQQ